MRIHFVSLASLIWLSPFYFTALGATPDFQTQVKSAVSAKTASARLESLCQVVWRHHLVDYPEEATEAGFPGFNDRWTDLSANAIARRKKEWAIPYAAMARIERGKLTPAQQLNYDLLRYDLDSQKRAEPFSDEYLSVTQLGGVQQDAPMTLADAPARTRQDYEDILARLHALPRLIEQTTALMKEGLSRGITPARVTLRDVPDQVTADMEPSVEKNPLTVAFNKFPDALSESDRKDLTARAQSALTREIIPAYQSFRDFLVKTYLPGARESLAMSALPNGKAWYQERVHESTTTDMTPDQINELGLKEVERIHGEMDKVIAQVGFHGSFDDFGKFLRSDPRFFYSSASDLLTGYRDIAKRIDPGLITLFGKLPRLPYGVMAVPAFAEKSQTTAYYEPGSDKAGRPGWFNANTYALNTRPKWEMEALTAHEAVPGHHLQISLAEEMEGVPDFRKFAGYTAFVEGWALYAEGLGASIGLYRDPYSHFGQLTYDMWRAIRLVLDTSIHWKGWTRDQAIRYFRANSPKTDHDIEVEVDRYIVWPGQALAYKIGQLTIQKLRRRAEEELGPRFDIRAFHDVVLRDGAVPMSILEQRVEEWLRRKNT